MSKPQPKYGWWGQDLNEPSASESEKDRFAVGTRVYIGPDRSDPIIAEVIAYGTPPALIAHMDYLVHLKIIEPGFMFPLLTSGHEDYWQEWQLEDIDE